MGTRINYYSNHGSNYKRTHLSITNPKGKDVLFIIQNGEIYLDLEFNLEDLKSLKNQIISIIKEMEEASNELH